MGPPLLGGGLGRGFEEDGSGFNYRAVKKPKRKRKRRWILIVREIGGEKTGREVCLFWGIINKEVAKI